MKVDIKPNHRNWRQFCEETAITDEEYAERLRMVKTVKADSLQAEAPPQGAGVVAGAATVTVPLYKTGHAKRTGNGDGTGGGR